MPPHTPRSKSTRSGNTLTPSFTFGLGLLPSFKFGSPRNMSLLSSISPHRFFNRFAKGKDELDLPDGLDPPVAVMGSNNADIFSEFSPKEARDSFIDDLADGKKKFDMDTTADLICTGDSVDLWSLANDDSQNPSMTINLTSIHEEVSTSKDADLFLSPDDLFLQNPAEIRKKDDPKLQSSPIDDDQLSETSSKKRKLSESPDSPCKLLATRIDSIGSPVASVSPAGRRDLNTSKLWTPSLDAVLIACYRKYRIYKSGQLPDSASFKHMSQNKILSRMLFNKTGVVRSPKQVSSRIFRLNKARLGEARAKSPEPRVKEELSVAVEANNTLASSPVSGTPIAHHHIEVPSLAVDSFTMAFNYNLPIQGTHSFSKLMSESLNTTKVSNTLELRSALSISNAQFHTDFEKFASKLIALAVPVYDVKSQINFKPSEDATSTPTSPLTNPRSFTIENGNFSCHLGMRLAANACSDDFISWKSCMTIYKDEDKVLLRSRELINGYKRVDGTFEFQIPFLNNFWAGYLTFLINGSNDFKDLKSLRIVQVIYEGDDENFGKVHGLLSYRFENAKMNQGTVSVSLIKIETGADNELDDNATVLASSSPVKASTTKSVLSVNTTLANTNMVPGPLSIPTYNANVVRKFNPNYNGNGAGTPMDYQPSSATSMYPMDMPYQGSPETLDTPASINMSGLQSAGQMMVQPTHNMAPVEVVQAGRFDTRMSHGAHTQFQTPIPPGVVMANPAMGAHYIQNMSMVPHGMTDGVAPRYDTMHTSGMAPQTPLTAGIAPGQQWGMVYPRPEPVYSHPPINSAPASQVQFFPKNAANSPNPGRASNKPGNTITFGPILGYDPSKDVKDQSKRAKPGVHKFLQNPQVMYKPKKS